MKIFTKNTWFILFVIAVLPMLLFVSCKKKYNYHISGTVVNATTQESLEGVQVEVFHTECQGYGLAGGGCPHVESHYATTNAKGEFEMAFTSEKSRKGIIFNKKYLGVYYSGLEGPYIDSGTSLLNNVSMHSETEWFTIDFEPITPNVQTVTLQLEWNRFSGGNPEKFIWGTFPPYFTIFDNPRRPASLENIGEQWLKMNFDILLEDGSHLQKTDSIWLPGRYYDLGFGDGPPNPVYKFTY